MKVSFTVLVNILSHYFCIVRYIAMWSLINQIMFEVKYSKTSL